MKSALTAITQELAAIREAGTWREERIITTAQKSRVDTTVAKGVVNMCANNYLGLSAHPELMAAAKESYDKWGFGLSSVRFICGTQQDVHCKEANSDKNGKCVGIGQHKIESDCASGEQYCED